MKSFFTIAALLFTSYVFSQKLVVTPVGLFWNPSEKGTPTAGISRLNLNSFQLI